MTTYFVGPENDAQTNVELEEAMLCAQNGDVIVFQPDFVWGMHLPSVLEIDKSIELKGHCNLDGASLVYDTKLPAITIGPNVRVTLTDLQLTVADPAQNTLKIGAHAEVLATNLLIENIATHGENYPIIFIEDGAEVTFNNLTVPGSLIADGQHAIFVQDAVLNIKKAKVAAKIMLDNGRMFADGLVITYRDGHGIQAYNSAAAVLSNGAINAGGVNGEEILPAVYADSQAALSFKNVEINRGRSQDQGSQIYAEDATLAFVDSKVDAQLAVRNTDLTIDNIELNYVGQHASLYLANDTTATIIRSVINGGTSDDNSIWRTIYTKRAIVTFDEVQINRGRSHQGDSLTSFIDSEILLLNSIVEAQIELKHTNLIAEYVTLSYFKGKALIAEQRSIVQIKHSDMEGGQETTTETWPSIYIDDSDIRLIDNDIIHPTTGQGLYVSNSDILLEDNRISAATFNHSQIESQRDHFLGSLRLTNADFTADKLTIFGYDNGQVNLAASQGTIINAQVVHMGHLSTPAIRLANDVNFNVPTTCLLAFDAEARYFALDKQAHFKVLQMDLEIDRFNEE